MYLLACIHYYYEDTSLKTILQQSVISSFYISSPFSENLSPYKNPCFTRVNDDGTFSTLYLLVLIWMFMCENRKYLLGVCIKLLFVKARNFKIPKKNRI